MNERESVFSSLSRLKGAQRIAEQDARRSLELDALIARQHEVTLTLDQRRRQKARRAREARRSLAKGPRASCAPRPATFSTGRGWDKGEGI